MQLVGRYSHLDDGQVRVLVRADDISINLGTGREIHFHLRLGTHHVGIRDDISVRAVDPAGAERIAGQDGDHTRADRLVERHEFILLVRTGQRSDQMGVPQRWWELVRRCWLVPGR